MIVIMLAIKYLVVALLLIWSVTLAHYLMILFFALLPKRQLNNTNADGKTKRFSILIPAHNESAVISYLVDSLMKQDYPKESYKVFVIADNCDDDTANVARSCGAHVLERFDNDRRGKSYAINWALEEIKKDGFDYDAIIFFDADNLVSSKYLKSANEVLDDDSEVFQGPVESKTPSMTHIAAFNHIILSAYNRVFENGRSRLGFGANLGGRNMIFRRRLIERTGWKAGSITEDREFTQRLLIEGIRVRWFDGAKVYGEVALNYKQSANQQSRWFRGWTQNAVEFIPLLFGAWRKKKDPAFLDAIFLLARPLLSAGNGIAALPLLFLAGSAALWVWWLCTIAVFYIYFGAGLFLNRSETKYYVYLLFFPFYKLMSLWAAISGYILKDKNTWQHDQHVAGVSIDDIEE